ncbi:cytochrome P450 [Cristinia sonorae]|uniref:Cytochrome P450 n=1 Tax=Cristinia sonorae TaxID=1940300 RepID=A0A8K0UP74_9AGAR|nr:cytochrome P450 [Cristinia sonorae]
MAIDSATLLAVALLLPTSLLVFSYALAAYSRPPFPGPKGIPFVGNIVPREDPWSTLRKWSKQYGPVYGLRVLSTPVVVINSVQAARELLENRSNIYSNRVPPKMAELSGLDEGILFQTHVGRLRQGRKLLATGLQARELEAYQPLMRDSVTKFCADVIRDPKNWLKYLHRVPTEVSLDIAYGHVMKGLDDPFVAKMNEVTRHFESATAFSVEEGYVVNFLPFLSKFPSFLPGMSFKRRAARWKAHFMTMAKEGLERVKDEVARGVARPSMLSRALTEAPGSYSDDVMMRCAPQLLTGGSDTIISLTSTFLLAILHNPEVQIRAQAEIDQVIGNERIPTYKDKDSLPYVYAIVRECIRWRTALPTIYRNLVKDDEFEGRHISQRSTIFINYQGILRNDDVYPDADAFRPERWLDPKVLGNKDIDPLEIAFGFGRRVCPGKFLALDLGFQLIVAMLTVFKVSKAKDVSGVEITPKVEYTNGSVVWPVPFQCDIQPRSVQAKQLVDHAVNAL